MIGLLSHDEMTQMLQLHNVGRLACTSNDQPYIVPINYVFQCDAIYAYSMPGRKISMMREQPFISFEIDEIDGPSNWRSVIAEGVYEELTGPAGTSLAKRMLANGYGSLVARSLEVSSPIVLFRIHITGLSGRFERRNA
jgi:nitroimidazol reductase NimA-like FMN-containing flavoprotein (pyridoxamine 5'-phosphate oxidase superfamily)